MTEKVIKDFHGDDVFRDEEGIMWVPFFAQGELVNLRDATRVEIIGPVNREVVRFQEVPGVVIHIQDDGRTVKIFAGDKR